MSEDGVLAGRLLSGRYRVDRLLGRGGMASVWSGVDQQMGRQVAIKVLHLTGPAGSAAWARFEREARSTAALNDPHIVTVHDTGIDDGTAYLVLELLPGPTLAQYLTENGPMPIPTVLDVTAQVCEGLSAAHALGIVHRDIKPSNVMFADHHRIKVLDFGITQLVGEAITDATLTAPGESLGTPAFMAPEQIAGGRVEARTDLYALGCLITAMLSGKPPFHDASPLSVIASHAHHTPPDVRLARTDTPAPLAALVAALLSKRPEDRPASADVVLEAVRDLASVDATASTAGAGRRRLAAIGVAGLALVVAGGGSYMAVGAPGWPVKPPTAVSRPLASASTEVTPTPSVPTMVSLEATTLGSGEPLTTPLTQWCQHPDGYGVAYPEGWLHQACGLFGAVPLSETAWESDGPPAPVSIILSTDMSFDEVLADSSTRTVTVTGQEDEIIDSLRIVRMESVLDDNGGEDYLPDGTPKVSWVVELPPAGNGGVLIGTAFPNAAVVGGVAEGAQRDSMDVAENAAVLDAMMRSVVLTVFDDTVTLNESLEIGFSGVGKAMLGMTMTDFAGALGADLEDVLGADPCYQASFVADGTGFDILSEGGRNGPVQLVEVGPSGERPGRGRPVVGTAQGIHLGSTYADVMTAFPDAVVGPAPHIPGGERLTVVDTKADTALVFDTDAGGKVILMRSGVSPEVHRNSAGCE